MNIRVDPKYLVYIISILTPYVCTIFLKNELGLFISLPIFLISLGVLIACSVDLTDKARTHSLQKWWPALGAFFAVLLFFLSYGFQSKIHTYLVFKWQETQLNQFVADIKEYEKINDLSDGQRFWKKLNNVAVEPNRKDTISAEWPGEKYFLDTILKRDGIDKGHYESFRQQLITLGFISFTKLNDGTLSFTTDGFLDNCYGFAYSETGVQPTHNDCGDIIFWQQVGEHWYAWGTT